MPWALFQGVIPMSQSSFSNLAPTVTPEVGSLTKQFELAWQGSGAPPALEPFVARAGGHIGVLIDLVCVDMENRYARAERQRVETYLTLVPELGRDEAAVVSLIEWEYLLRQRHQDPVEVAEFEKRFPALRSALAGLLSRLRAGRYVFQGELGGGGMGVVFRALDSDCERTLAVKVLRPECRHNAQAQARFLFEARLTARLQQEQDQARPLAALLPRRAGAPPRQRPDPDAHWHRPLQPRRVRPRHRDVHPRPGTGPSLSLAFRTHGPVGHRLREQG
jgi:hypothetical protein